MKALKIFLFTAPLLIVSSAYALGDYSTPEEQKAKDDITTQTGTFPVEDERELNMQSEEERQDEADDLDSFGEDKFNKNIDPDVSDDIEKQNY